jgi:hypothetical protein
MSYVHTNRIAKEPLDTSCARRLAPRRLFVNRRASLLLAEVLACFIAIGASVKLSPVALAGSMHVYTCRTPTAQIAPTDGWSGSVVGSFVRVVNSCAAKGTLVAELDNVSQPANGALATWTFTTPANMMITAARLEFEGESSQSQLEPGQAAQTLFYLAAPNNTYDSSDVFFQCPDQGCAKTANRKIDVPPANLEGSTHLYMDAACGGAGGAVCPQQPYSGELVAVSLTRADITLFHAADPTVANISGSLLAPGVLHGSVNLLFSAYDQGAGIYQAIFQVDGHTVASQVVDSNSGRCQNVGGTTDGTFAFLYTEPCKRQVSADLSFDTTQILDGTHRLKVLVQNATGDIATVVDTTITVENRALQSGYSPLEHANPLLGDGVLTHGACNGTGCDNQARIVVNRWTRILTHTYRGSVVKLSGRLVSHTGAQIVGAQLDLIQRPAATGYGPVVIATTTTGPDGSWTLVAPRGPSRELEVAYRSHVGDPAYAAHVELSERIKAPVTLSAPRHVEAGVSFLFRGRLFGGYIPPGGSLVSVEIFYGGEWRLLVNTRTGKNGAFRYRYAFEPGYPPTRYQFRATVLSIPGYPFTTGHSRTIRVGVG